MKTACILVWYDGGGYDGCHFEANFYLVDSIKRPTVFQDIFSSGCSGIMNLDELRRKSPEIRDTYDLRKDKEWERFNESFSVEPHHIVMVANWLLSNREDLYRKVRCTNCGEYFDIDEVFLAGFHGDGGIGLLASVCTCESCDIKDAWDSYVKEYLVDELRKQGVEFDEVSPEDVDRILLEAIDYTSACWEGEGDDRHLYKADDVVRYIVDNPDYVKRMLCEDKQLELTGVR